MAHFEVWTILINLLPPAFVFIRVFYKFIELLMNRFFDHLTTALTDDVLCTKNIILCIPAESSASQPIILAHYMHYTMIYMELDLFNNLCWALTSNLTYLCHSSANAGATLDQHRVPDRAIEDVSFSIPRAVQFYGPLELSLPLNVRINSVYCSGNILRSSDQSWFAKFALHGKLRTSR